MYKSSKGFTLVELLVVIAIIGLLASVVIFSVNSARSKARDSRRAADMKALTAAIELYKNNTVGSAPGSASGTFATDLNVLVTNGFIGKIPADPKDSGIYQYIYSNAGFANETYYINFVTENASPLGPAGNYCATSLGIAVQTGGICSER